MPVNQVNMNGEELINLINDTVSEETLLKDVTAHDASGNQITGKLYGVPVDSELNAESTNAIQNKAVASGINNAINEAKIYANGIISNPNLLDNPNFSINQRGASGTITDTGYFIDRWKLVSGTATIGADKTLTLNGTIVQILESAVGNSVTASASAGTASYNNSTRTFTLTASGEKIAWAKLELGSVATAFVPPNPATELAKCQRQFQRIKSLGVKPISYSTPVSSGLLPVLLYLPVSMRISPTMTTSGASVFSYSTGATNNTTAPSGATITKPIGNDNGYALLCINVYGAYTLGTTYAAWLMDGDYIDLSADL